MKIDWFKPTYWGKEEKYVLDAIRSYWISDGEYIQKFETLFSSLNNATHTITVNNGTSALHLALLTLGIGQGDEVIIPGYTFAAPANMVKMVGATPVFVDVDKDTWCLNPDLITQAITKKTKAIIPVHIYGNVCNMNAIMAIANQYKLFIIEDTAEAAFSLYNDKPAGTFGEIGCFSFQSTKTITMGEGGAVVINNDHLIEKARLIRNHGMQGKKRYWHYEIGHNFRLTNYQAALGLAQLEHLTDIKRQKQMIMAQYQDKLGKINGITFQQFDTAVQPVVWCVAIQLDTTYFTDATHVRDALYHKGIETRSGFYPFNEMPHYNAPFLPVTNHLSKNIVNLPSYTSITKEEINYICQQLIALRI